MSKKNVVKITVSGGAGTGKSVILYNIKKMLKEKFNIDASTDFIFDWENKTRDLDDTSKFKLNVNCVLEEHQEPRRSVNDAGEKLKVYQKAS